MGNDPGPLKVGESATVLLVMKGKVDASTAQAFKDDLEALVKKYKPDMGSLTRPIKGQSSARSKKKKK